MSEEEVQSTPALTTTSAEQQQKQQQEQTPKSAATTEGESSKWYPSRIFSPINDNNNPTNSPNNKEIQTKKEKRDPYAVLILNQPLNTRALDSVVSAAEIIVCADGGANRYAEFVRSRLQLLDHDYDNSPEEKGKERKIRLPDAIIGDLDSLSPDTVRFFRELASQQEKEEEGEGKKETKLIKDGDQYCTDFAKCLKYLRGYSPSSSRISHGDGGGGGGGENEQKDEKETGIDVIVLGSLGGRVDQGLSQLHHLYLAISDDRYLRRTSTGKTGQKEKGGNRIYLLSESSLSFMLEFGVNEIFIDDFDVNLKDEDEDGGGDGDEEGKEKEGRKYKFTQNIGILPLAGPATITTQGLEWDVTDWKTCFGGDLSTSNHIQSQKVVVDVKKIQDLDVLYLDDEEDKPQNKIGGVDGDLGYNDKKEKRTIKVPGTRCIFTFELQRDLRSVE